MSKTMSHTEAQRKDWHAGKKQPHETRQTWFRRVMVRAGNMRGAYTPRGLRIVYKPIDDRA